MNSSAKRPVNVKAPADLVADAKAHGINLSSVFEEALDQAVRKARLAKWQEENAQAFAAYDRRIEENGVFSSGKRRF